MGLDFESLRSNANAYASNNLDCAVTFEGETPDGKGIFVMTDEEGIETSRVEVEDAGTYLGTRMMRFDLDAMGDVLCGAYGDVLARLMWC